VRTAHAQRTCCCLSVLPAMRWSPPAWRVRMHVAK
jgi:hypothetical protein